MLDRIALITGSAGKAAEYAAMLGIEVTSAKAELTEVQSLDVAVVAARKAADAYAQLGEPVLVDDTGLTVHAWNGLPGALAAEPRGTYGFGYDSIFIPDSDSGGRTYAQLTSEEKNKISHRRRAVEEMRNALGLA